MGADRITEVFTKQAKHAAFMPYVVAGYPDLDKSTEIIQALVKSGADMLELGVPFSDPIADGPVIQAASQQALKFGVTLQGCLDLAAHLREGKVQIPIVLMSYVNPLIAFGLKRCVETAVSAGIDGFIVPDLPPEEAIEFETLCKEKGLALIFLLAPTSSAERVQLVAQRSSGFIYLVSLTGVTGAREKLDEGLADFVLRVRSVSHLPLAVGFGISNAKQATSVSQLADGVIVGSALVNLAGKSISHLRSLADEINDALK